MAVVWHVTMSIDGFIAGPGDAMEWMLGYGGSNPEVDELISSIGAILAGRRSYDVGSRQKDPAFQKPYGGAWSGPMFVLTHRPVASRDPNLIFFTADIARQAVEKGLINELFVHIAPVMLGDGVRLFSRPSGGPVKLEPISISQPGQLTNLRLRFVK